jgi:hypothetical protein
MIRLAAFQASGGAYMKLQFQSLFIDYGRYEDQRLGLELKPESIAGSFQLILKDRAKRFLPSSFVLHHSSLVS